MLKISQAREGQWDREAWQRQTTITNSSSSTQRGLSLVVGVAEKSAIKRSFPNFQLHNACKKLQRERRKKGKKS